VTHDGFIFLCLFIALLLMALTFWAAFDFPFPEIFFSGIDEGSGEAFSGRIWID
jgi:hypothetical protein